MIKTTLKIKMKKKVRCGKGNVRKFTAFSDPAHGWIKTTRKLLVDLEIADKISGCSYQRENFVYLEEDCDWPILYDALFRLDIVMQVKESFSNKYSKIRSYECYQKPSEVVK